MLSSKKKKKKKKKLNKLACKFCDKLFTQKGTLNRHIDSIHNGSRNFKCMYCDCVYTYKHHLIRHIDVKHNKFRGIVTCDTCAQEFTTKDHLRRHIFTIHLNLNIFECDTCGKVFPRKESLRQHILTHTRSGVRSLSSTCPLCRESFTTQPDILHHFIKDHQLELETENHVFANADTFLPWKKSVEKQLYCLYRRRKIRSSREGIRKEVYSCHRSGYYVPRQSRQRRLKCQGSKKINAFCPSKITVRIYGDGIHHVEFVKTHLGHPVDDKELPHVQSRRRKKIPVDTWTSDVQNERENSFLSDEDVRDIAAPCDIEQLQPSQALLDDMIAVEGWVTENPSSVLFYKRPYEKHSSRRFRDEDFLLVFMREAQTETLKERSSELILTDGTYSDYGDSKFSMHTVMVLDECGEGYPCCFAISNRNDRIAIEVMFACIKAKIGSVSTKVFMTDMQNRYFDAWTEIMQSPSDFHLHCVWHVIHAWEVDYNKYIFSEEKKDFVREQLLELLTENDLIRFHRNLGEFLQNNDEELQYFISNFVSNYLTNTDLWAFCYRQHSNLKTMMSFENFHRALNYVYGRGYVIGHVADALHAIDMFLNVGGRDEYLADDIDVTTVVYIQADEAVTTQEMKIHNNDDDDDYNEVEEEVHELEIDDFDDSSVTDPNILKKQFSSVIEASINDPRKLRYIEEMFQKLDETLDSFD